MKTIRLAILSLVTLVGSLVASAQQATAEAFVASVTGSATVTAPGSDKAVALVVGQALPEGSTVTTAPGATVMIQSHEGMQTGVGSASTVVVGAHSVSTDGLRTAVIDLKQGTTVSVLDPTKRAVNNYAVRTPKGVAAARGTIYSTTVTLSTGGVATVTVNTMTGAVSFAISGGETISVTEGRSCNSSSTTTTTIAEAYAKDGANTAELVEATKLAVAVAQIVAQSGGADQTGTLDSSLSTVKNSLPAEIAEAVKDGQAAGKEAAKTATVTTTTTGQTSIKADVQLQPDATPKTTLDITNTADVSPSSNRQQ
jgi:hypothetical protein